MSIIESLIAAAIIAAEDIDAEIPPTPRAEVEEEEQEESKYPAHFKKSQHLIYRFSTTNGLQICFAMQ